MKRSLPWIPAISLLILISCAGQPEVSDNPVTVVPEQVVAEENTADSLSINTYPAEGQFRITALSPRLQFDEDERLYAMANAARLISIHNGARVRYAKVVDENIIGTIHDQKVEVLYDRDLAISYLDQLTIESESRSTDYYAALITMEGQSPTAIPELPLNFGEKPSWIANPPSSDNYIFGVGASGRRKSVYESWEQADKLAMAEIANFIETKVYSGIASIEKGGEKSGASASSVKTLTWSDVYIEGIYIVSRWREPNSNYFYSLAVAEKPE